MSIFKKAWNALQTKYLGGEVRTTYGAVHGEPAMGTTADLQKASGEIRVHVVRTKENTSLVTIELLQHELPGDAPEMACVRLPASEAARLGTMLTQAAQAAELDDASAAASPGH